MKNKITTKVRAERAAQRAKRNEERKLTKDRVNSAFVSVKDFCKEHAFSERIFRNEIVRQQIEVVDFVGESTGNQKAHGIKREKAEELIKVLRKTLLIREDEITLADLARKLGVSVGSLRVRLKNHGIEGRVVRYHDETNPKLHHQPTTAYRLEDVAELKKECKISHLEKGEVTLQILADRLELSKHAIYARLKVRGIKGRKARYPADHENKAFRNQPTIAYSEADLVTLCQDFRKKA